MSAPGWSCNSPGTGGVLTCTLASLGNGNSASDIEISGTIAVSAGGTFFSNSAGVTTTSTDPRQGNNTASTTDTATPGADLAVTKNWDTDLGTAGIQNDPVLPGDIVEILLTVTNNGPNTAVNATLEDVVPNGVEVTAVDSGCTETPANTINCNFGNLNNGDVVTVTVTATVQPPPDPVQGATIENIVTVDSDTDDAIPSNNTDRDSLTVVPAADMVLTKSATPLDPAVGDQVEYTIQLRNDGPSAAAGVSVSDPLPARTSLRLSIGRLQLGAAAPSPARPPAAPSPPATTSPSRSPSTVTGGAGPGRSQRAEVTTTSPHDPDPTNNRSTTTVNVQPRADLAITKTASDTTPAIDQDVTFELSMTNNGPNAAQDVVIDDAIPAGMTFVAASPGLQPERRQPPLHDRDDRQRRRSSPARSPCAPGPPCTARTSSTRPRSAAPPTTRTRANDNDDAAITVGERVDLAIQKTVSPTEHRRRADSHLRPHGDQHRSQRRDRGHPHRPAPARPRVRQRQRQPGQLLLRLSHRHLQPRHDRLGRQRDGPDRGPSPATRRSASPSTTLPASAPTSPRRAPATTPPAPPSESPRRPRPTRARPESASRRRRAGAWRRPVRRSPSLSPCARSARTRPATSSSATRSPPASST